ncbi:MAG: hypothetical protein HYV76_02230 [Candidatus Vogelbacteria bacterium]|nr:hypothetical protein [Candidatus Vogelbacteria bacterium]
MIWRHSITIIIFLSFIFLPWWLSASLLGAAMVTLSHYYESAGLVLIFEWWYHTVPAGETLTWPWPAIATLALVVIINKLYEHIRFLAAS